MGFVEKRVGTMYNDNGSLNYRINGVNIPYPVNQAITIQPFNVVNVFANYTIRNASWFRGSKLGLAVNNLADSHNIVGVTPATAATLATAYVPSGGDQLNLLPGRSVMATLTVGWAPRR
jgi:iron complex outermembrane receptor protein